LIKWMNQILTLLEEYMKTLDGKENKGEAEEKYKEKARKLRKKYEKLYEKSIHPGFIKKYLIKIRVFTDKLAEKLGR